MREEQPLPIGANNGVSIAIGTRNQSLCLVSLQVLPKDFPFASRIRIIDHSFAISCPAIRPSIPVFTTQRLGFFQHPTALLDFCYPNRILLVGPQESESPTSADSLKPDLAKPSPFVIWDDGPRTRPVLGSTSSAQILSEDVFGAGSLKL